MCRGNTLVARAVYLGVRATPAEVGEDLGFEEGVEQPVVQVLVAHPAVEAPHPGVLPGRARVDEDRLRGVGAAPVGDGLSDELGPIVEAQVGGTGACSGDLVEVGDDVVGVDRAVGLNGERLPGELVDDVQELDRPSLRRWSC